ncbi:iron ABC transporter permease [Solibacillus sp. FSL R7-0682]|uniref:FecCD family ABC transporter permease n=1 Tax=Solibacillus sp. FSL R7-0682 TaxID=2921690 RepID=UPI0030F79BF9
MRVKEEKSVTSIHPLAKKRAIVLITLPILLFVVSIGSLMIGQVSFSVGEVFQGIVSSDDSLARRIVWEIRFPRILVGIIVGMCLAIAGAMLQGIMQNPLADPGVIGITAGAGIMAVLVMIVFPGYLLFLPIAAFSGAFVAAMIVYILSVKKGGTSPTRIILVGVAVNAICGAGTNMLMMLFSDRVQSVLPWLSGGLMGVGWVQFESIIYYVLFALLLAIYSIKHIRIMRLGDEMAQLLGHNVEQSRLFLIVISTLLAGLAVSVARLVGFVGLVVPHMIRLLIGGDYRYLIPASAIGGALLVVFADTIARSVFNPIEIPVGILLAFIGGPYFLYLIHRRGNSIATN